MLQKQTLTVHFYLSTHPSETLVFALSGTRTHVSLITSRASLSHYTIKAATLATQQINEMT